MPHSVFNPSDLHDPSAMGYSHTAAVPAKSELVFVSGQYGAGADGSVVSADFAEQVQQAFRNLAIALAAHGLDLSHVVQMRTYVVNVDYDKLAVIGKSVAERWGSTPPAQTLVGAASLALPEMLFEVEAVAAR